MEKIWMENKAEWLFNLANGDLDDDSIVKGFLKHYALCGQGTGNVKQDLLFHMQHVDFYLESAMSSLNRALWIHIEAPDRSEMRTLDEVEMIVQAVRSGVQVQVDYYDPEIDDNPYVVRATW